ncbi:MAG: hypothetical protein FWE40_00960 [Oscillospiraceae bacterium]|nr:hypothetical protein [Oscillospiraceae bacterium]
MSVRKKLLLGGAAILGVILFMIFIVPRDRDIPVDDETTVTEVTESTTQAEETTSTGYTDDWPDVEWITEPDATVPVTTSPPSTQRPPQATAQPPATTTRPPSPATTTTRPTTSTTRPPTTTQPANLLAFAVDYGRSIGLTFRPQLTSGGVAVGASQAQVRARLDSARAAGHSQFNVWQVGNSIFIATQ